MTDNMQLYVLGVALIFVAIIIIAAMTSAVDDKGKKSYTSKNSTFVYTDLLPVCQVSPLYHVKVADKLFTTVHCLDEANAIVDAVRSVTTQRVHINEASELTLQSKNSVTTVVLPKQNNTSKAQL